MPPEAWTVTECPNGFPPRVSICKNPNEVYLAKRLPWSHGYYLVEPIYAEVANGQ